MLHSFIVTPKENELDELYKAVSDQTRRRIIDELSVRDNQSLFEICTRLLSQHEIGISRQAISRHLGVLEQVGIIDVEWQGNTKIHSLNRESLKRLVESWISNYGADG